MGKLRARRLKWAGQLLRKEPGTSMARDVLEKTAMNPQEKGKYSLLMDAPDFESWHDLVEMAHDDRLWTAAIRKCDPEFRRRRKRKRKPQAQSQLDVRAPSFKPGNTILDTTTLQYR